MAIKVGSFVKSVDAAPAAQTIPNIGFTTKALIMWSTSAVDLTSWHDSIVTSIGMTDCVTQRAGCGSLRNPPGLETQRWADAILTLYSYSGSLLAEARFDSADNDNIYITWTTNNAVACYVNYIAIGGDNITDVTLVEWMLLTGSGNQSVSTVGFEPDVVMNLGAYLGALGNAGRAYLSFGAMDAAGGEYSTGFGATHGMLGSYARTSAGFCCYTVGRSQLFGGPPLFFCHYVSMDANGFTISKAASSGGSHLVASLCIKGGNYKVGGFDSAGAPGIQSVGSLGFSPEGYIIFSDNSFSNTSLATIGGAQMQVGASDGVDQADTYIGGLVSTNRADAVIAMGSALGDVDVAAHSGLGVDDFAIDWSLIGSGLNDYGYVALGTGTEGGTLIPPSLVATSICFHEVSVSWDAVAGVDGYSIERSLDGVGGWLEVENTAGLSYVDTDCEHSTTYYYRARSYLGVNYSDYSVVSSATTPPGNPTLHAVAVGNHEIYVSWATITCATHYSIEMSLDGVGGWGEIIDTALLQTSETGLDFNTTHCYRGRSRYAAKYSAYSDVVCATTGIEVYVPPSIVLPVPEMTIFKDMPRSITTLQSKKVPWAHQSRTLHKPGWLGKNTKIKSTG